MILKARASLVSAALQ